MIRDNQISLILVLLTLVLLYLGLTWFSSSVMFLLAGAVYIAIIFGVSAFVDKEQKLNFTKIVTFFLLVYTIYATLVHFVFIDDPFSDAFVNIDAYHFFSYAVTLSKFSYSEIWHTAFTQFKYSGSPLFYAWIGTLQKVADLNSYYSLLFQKLNVAFLGSFIPGIVYLLCNRITTKKNAFKAAIAYGLLSFTFFYSVGLMRDIHVALIFAIGLYIITGDKVNFKNYLMLALLGILAFFLRFENGLFFLAFIGVAVLKSGGKNKYMVATVSFAGFVAVIVVIGGIGTIYQMALGTIQGYSQRAIMRAGQSSLAVQIMKMPIPVNWIGMTAFGQIGPFPFLVVFREEISAVKNIFYLPEVIAGLFWFSVWMRIIRYPKQAMEFYRQYKYVVLTVILYLVVVSMAQPGARRLMAVYPMIFMAYIYISNNIFKAKELLINILVYGSLLVVYSFLKV